MAVTADLAAWQLVLWFTNLEIVSEDDSIRTVFGVFPIDQQWRLSSTFARP